MQFRLAARNKWTLAHTTSERSLTLQVNARSHYKERQLTRYFVVIDADSLELNLVDPLVLPSGGDAVLIARYLPELEGKKGEMNN